jgi:hypothetical protein
MIPGVTVEVHERARTGSPTPLTVYPETPNLKTEIGLQPVGTRPLLKIEEADHWLAEDQSAGMSSARAMELASLCFIRNDRRL